MSAEHVLTFVMRVQKNVENTKIWITANSVLRFVVGVRKNVAR
jgi:hypothetical protein